MKILGIDPGLRVTGFGVIRKEGQRLSYIASGTIQVPDGDLPSRLKVILEGVGQVVSNYQPDCAAIEIVFSNVNPQSTLLLGKHGVPLFVVWLARSYRSRSTPHCKLKKPWSDKAKRKNHKCKRWCNGYLN